MNRLVTIIFIVLLSTWSFGQVNYNEQHPIDQKLEKCLSIDTNFTTSGMINCQEIARNEWDLELQKNYEILIEVLDSTAKDKLMNSQEQWIEYRDKETDFINHLYYSIEGTMWRVIAAGRRTEIVKVRSRELADYLKILNEIE